MSEWGEKYEVVSKFQQHIPYLIDAANSSKDSLEFTNLAL
jgi:hypothetical protein